MTNLFIIGNGFDLAHGMKTKYSDFRKFLIHNYLDDNYNPYSFCEVPQRTLMPDGDEQYNKNDVVKSILKILDDTEGVNWNKIEYSLGILEYGHFLDDYGDYDPDDDNYIRNMYYKNQDLSKELCGALRQIKQYFHEWVDTININKIPIKSFQKIIHSKDDLFITFNYTKTLENLYNIQNVCHIHGTAEDEIYFGHGNVESKLEKYENYWFGAETTLERLDAELRKNTIEAYNNHKDFFNKLYIIGNKTPLNIYSYGFSFSEVDEYYLIKIFENLNTNNMCFYINNYDDEKTRKKFANTLRKCGFKGKIDIFFK